MTRRSAQCGHCIAVEFSKEHTTLHYVRLFDDFESPHAVWRCAEPSNVSVTAPLLTATRVVRKIEDQDCAACC